MNENESPSQPRISKVETPVKKDAAPQPLQRKKNVLDALSQYWRYGKWFLAGSILAVGAARAAAQDNGPADTSMNEVQPVVQQVSQEYLNGYQDPEVFNIAIEHRLEQRGNDVVLVIENPYGEDVDFLRISATGDEKVDPNQISYDVMRVTKSEGSTLRFIGKLNGQGSYNVALPVPTEENPDNMRYFGVLTAVPAIYEVDMLSKNIDGIQLSSNIQGGESSISFDVDGNIDVSLNGKSSSHLVRVNFQIPADKFADYLNPIPGGGLEGFNLLFSPEEIENLQELPMDIVELSYTLND